MMGLLHLSVHFSVGQNGIIYGVSKAVKAWGWDFTEVRTAIRSGMMYSIV